MKSGPIILIEDDDDDIEIFENACSELRLENKLIALKRSSDALIYLSEMEEQPFFIICDVNMPQINGLQIRDRIDQNETLRLKALPFLMWSTSGIGSLVRQAYSLNIQGFFKKPSNLEDVKKIISAITVFWNFSQQP